MDGKNILLSLIPQVDKVLNHPDLTPYYSYLSHDFILFCVQQEVNSLRKKILNNEWETSHTQKEILAVIVDNAIENIKNKRDLSLKKVINGTGIILHTGLGRAPLSKDAQENIQKVIEGYCNLELDLETGKRGSRINHVEEILCFLTGAEAACVVNNNAAAVLLTLNTLGYGKESIISRGQLVEIGGSFRMPDVMEKSGTKMVEVGTTNKTHFSDYEKNINENTGLICIVHTSNYRIRGFTKEVAINELVELAHQNDLPVVHDLGGGVLVNLQQYGLPHEPVAKDSIDLGVDVVTFSGDKVLGGPQSGIIVGKKKYLDLIKANPFMRALRCDKIIYAALEPALKQYLNLKDLKGSNQVFKLLFEPLNNLYERATKILNEVKPLLNSEIKISVADSVVQIGSGALPLEELPSKALSIFSETSTAETLSKEFRKYNPPIVGYIKDNQLFLDLRTVFEYEDIVISTALKELLT